MSQQPPVAWPVGPGGPGGPSGPGGPTAPGPAQPGAAHARRRMRNLLILAGVLAATALLPQYDPVDGRLVLALLEVLRHPAASDLPWFLLVYPLLAAAGTAAVALWLRGPAGSLVLMLLGGAFLAALGLEATRLLGQMELPVTAEPPSGLRLNPLGLAALVGMGAMFAGARARSIRPAGLAAWAVGAVGGACWLGAVAIAAAVGGWNSFLWQVVQMTSHPLYAWFAMFTLAGLASTAGSAFFCLVNTPRQASRILAQQAFFLLAVGLLFLAGGVLVTVAGTQWRGATVGPAEFYNVVAAAARFGLSAVLLALLAPIGLADLLTRLPKAPTV